LNGSYADQKHWRRVIDELGGDYRHITYDERAIQLSAKVPSNHSKILRKDFRAVADAAREIAATANPGTARRAG
ncbi:hypothetical protein ACFC0T_18805, partial [Streptomyces gardneri]